MEDAGFEVLTVVTMRSSIFWNIICSMLQAVLFVISLSLSLVCSIISQMIQYLMPWLIWGLYLDQKILSKQICENML
jgi:uncharacterized protein YebE (UPF0316 family)